MSRSNSRKPSNETSKKGVPLTVEGQRGSGILGAIFQGVGNAAKMVAGGGVSTGSNSYSRNRLGNSWEQPDYSIKSSNETSSREAPPTVEGVSTDYYQVSQKPYNNPEARPDSHQTSEGGSTGSNTYSGHRPSSPVNSQNRAPVNQPDSNQPRPDSNQPSRNPKVSGTQPYDSGGNVEINKTLESIRKAFDKHYEFLEEKEKLWSEYKAKMEIELENTPKYEIPAYVDENIKQLENSANEVRDLYKSGGAEMKERVLHGIEDSLTTYTKGYDSMLESSGFAKDEMLSGAGNILNMAKRRASQDMPGLDLYHATASATTSDAIRRIKEYGGGSSATLGALSDIMTQQSRMSQDIAIQNAIYRDEAQNKLQDTMYKTTAMKAGAHQSYATANMQHAEGLGSAKMKAAAMGGDAIASATQMEGYGLEKATQYRNMANVMGAGYEDTAYQMNELMPWRAKTGYYSDMIKQTDPTGMQNQYYGDAAGTNMALYGLDLNKQLSEQMIKAGIVSAAIGGFSDMISSLFQGGGNMGKMAAGGG